MLVVDPCTEGAAVFGPETFARDRGSPQTEDREFTIEESGSFCVHVANDGAASARITLDALEIISPSDFNPHVTQIQKTVPVEPGLHHVQVRVTSGPGTSIDLVIRFSSYVRPDDGVEGPAGVLRLHDLNDVPDPFSPNGDGSADETRLSVIGDLSRIPGPPHFDYYLYSVFEIYSFETCELIRSVSANVEVDGSAAVEYPIQAAWDGMDDSGDVAADGYYAYRAAVGFIRINSGGVVLLIDAATTLFRTVRVDTAPPALVVDPDIEGMITNETPVPVIGYVIDIGDVRVFVNDEEAALLDSRFSGEADIAEGDNTILVSAMDDAGNETIVEKHVTLDTVPPEIGEATLDHMPADGAMLDTVNPLFEVIFSDVPAGVFGSGVVLLVNGAEQEHNGSITDCGISILLTSIISGTNTIRLEVPDRAGNISVRAYTFQLEVGDIIRINNPSSPIYRAALTVPAGALPEGEEPEFFLEHFSSDRDDLRTGAPAGDHTILAGPIVNIEPSGTVFEPSIPAELTLPYHPAALLNPGEASGYVPEEFIKVIRLENPQGVLDGDPPVWAPMGGPFRIDTAHNTVTIFIAHLTPFAASTTDIIPYVSINRAFLLNDGESASSDQTIEVIDLNSMAPTGERFNPSDLIATELGGCHRPVWLRSIKMLPEDEEDQGKLYAVVSCLSTVSIPPWEPMWFVRDAILEIDAITMTFSRRIVFGPGGLYDTFVRDFDFSEDGKKLYALVDATQGAAESSSGDGIYVADLESSGEIVESELILEIPIGTSAKILVQTVDDRDVAAITTIEGQSRVFWPPEPAFSHATSGEKYRENLDDYVGSMNYVQGGVSYGMMQVSEADHSGYSTYLDELTAGGDCEVFAFDKNGRIENWEEVKDTFIEDFERDCFDIVNPDFVEWFQDQPQRFSNGHLFGKLIAYGQIGLIDLDEESPSIIDTYPLHDSELYLESPFPSTGSFSFKDAPEWAQQHLGVLNDFSVDFNIDARVGYDAIIIKASILGANVIGYSPPWDTEYAVVWDGYVSAITRINSLAYLLHDPTEHALSQGFRIIDWEDGEWEPDSKLTAKSNLSIVDNGTEYGKAVAVNEHGRAVFIDTASDKPVLNSVDLPLAERLETDPDCGDDFNEHYVSASLSQGFILDGEDPKSVTIVALSDACRPQPGYIPADGFIYLFDNDTYELLPESLSLRERSMSFNADRSRHALVAYQDFPSGRVDAQFSLRPPRLAYDRRTDDTVDFIAILPPQDLDHDENPDDDEDFRPDVGLHALESGLDAVGPGGSAALRIFLFDSMQREEDETCVQAPGENFILVNVDPDEQVLVKVPPVHPGSEINVFTDGAGIIVRYINEDGTSTNCSPGSCPEDKPVVTLTEGGHISVEGYPIAGTGCDGGKQILADIVTQNNGRSAVSDALEFELDHTGPEVWLTQEHHVPVAGPVVIEFNEEIAPELPLGSVVVTRAGSLSAVAGSLSLEQVEHEGEDPERTSLIRFIPAEAFDDYTDYDVTLSAAIHDPSGNPLSYTDDITLPFRTRSRLIKKMTGLFPYVSMESLDSLEDNIPDEFLTSWLDDRGNLYEAQKQAVEEISEACYLTDGLEVSELHIAYTAVLSCILYTKDGIFYDQRIDENPNRRRQIIDLESLIMDMNSGSPSIMYDKIMDGGTAVSLVNIGFNSDFETGTFRSNTATTDGIWTFLPNAILTRYPELRHRGYVFSSIGELQDTLFQFLWYAGARHSPPADPSGPCAESESENLVECALTYLSSVLSDEAAIISGAMATVLLEEGVDTYSGLSILDIDAVLQALMEGRDLVDVAERSLMAESEIITEPNTEDPGIVSDLPAEGFDSTSGEPKPFDGTRLVSDGSFDSMPAGDINPSTGISVYADYATVTCLPDVSLVGGAVIVEGQEFFRTRSFENHAVLVKDLREWGIGVGSEWDSVENPNDKALAIALNSWGSVAGSVNEAYIELHLPRLVQEIEFDYLIWREEVPSIWDPNLETIIFIRGVDSEGVPLDGNEIQIDVREQQHDLILGYDGAGVDAICCPYYRMNDPFWGMPGGVDDFAVYDGVCLTHFSLAGRLCHQYQDDRFDWSSRCDYTGAKPYLPYRVYVSSGGYGIRHVSKQELGLSANSSGWIQIGIRSISPEGCGICDTLDDRLQIDNLKYFDCADPEPNELDYSSTEAVECVSLEAGIEAIGVSGPDWATDEGVGESNIPSVEKRNSDDSISVGPAIKNEEFGWRIGARMPGSLYADPGSRMNVTCIVKDRFDGLVTQFPALYRDRLNFFCERTGPPLEAGEPYNLGGSVSSIDYPDLSVDVPPAVAFIDFDHPAQGPEDSFDTFPPNHATFLAGDPVIIMADVSDDNALSTYRCDLFFDTSYFTNAYKIPDGSHEKVVFEFFPRLPIECAEFDIKCNVTDAAGRETRLEREAIIVSVDDFFIASDPAYDFDFEHGRYVVHLLREQTLQVHAEEGTELPPCVEMRYELAVEAVGDFTVDPEAGTFNFQDPGAYYIQGVVGRDVAGTFDPVKLSNNVIVALVTGYMAEIKKPDEYHRLGVAFPGAKFPQGMEVQLIDEEGDDIWEAGVEMDLEFETGEILSFSADADVWTVRVLTDSLGTARADLYVKYEEGGDDIVKVKGPYADPPSDVLDSLLLETKRVLISHPTGNPEGSDAGEKNEFCFNAVLPDGRMEIDTRAVWAYEPDPIPIEPADTGECEADPELVRCRITWHMDDVGDSTKRWDIFIEPNTTTGIGGENIVKFTGLPASYKDFGNKTVAVFYDELLLDDQTVQVFFAASAINHPGDHYTAQPVHIVNRNPDNIRDCPNWFYYGRKVLEEYYPDLILEQILEQMYYDSTINIEISVGMLGITPGIYDWLFYDGRRDVTLIADSAYRSMGTILYLDAFRDVAVHEHFHVVGEIMPFNTLDFEDTETGKIRALDATCFYPPPCGWAFANGGATILPLPAPYGQYYNRFKDLNDNDVFDYIDDGNGLFDNCIIDTCLDSLLDSDLDYVPDEYDINSNDPSDFDQGAINAEINAPDEFIHIEWSCPGRQAAIGQSPEMPCFVE